MGSDGLHSKSANRTVCNAHLRSTCGLEAPATGQFFFRYLEDDFHSTSLGWAWATTYGLHAKSPNWSMLSRFFRPENCCIKGGSPTRYKAHLLIHRIRCNKQPVHSEETISANLSLWGSHEHRCNEGFCLFHGDIHKVQSFHLVHESRTYSADLDFTRSQVS